MGRRLPLAQGRQAPRSCFPCMWGAWSRRSASLGIASGRRGRGVGARVSAGLVLWAYDRGDDGKPRKGVAMDSVLAVTFTEDSKAYEALSSLEELEDQGQVDLSGAAVVVRSEDGAS